MQITPFSSNCTKPWYKWIKGLHFKPAKFKLIEGNLGKILNNIGIGEIFLNKIVMAYALRSRINQWNIIKWQGFSKSKGKVIWKTRKAAEWKKIFQNPTYDRGIIYKMDKELNKLDSKEN